MEIKNLSQFRGKMRFTTVTENGEITVRIGSNEYKGTICRSGDGRYCVGMTGLCNDRLFELAGINKLTFVENILGYTDNGEGYWPWMKSTDDILKVLVELDKLYVSKEPGMEEPMSMEMEHPSIEDIDFTPRKKRYSFNFQM